MKASYLVTILAAMLALVASGASHGEAHAQSSYTLRIATLAPRGSSWMRVFDAWNATLKKQTQGRLNLRFYAGGVAGDERDFVRKMRAGQMDGAAVTQTGLGLIVRPVLVLAVPGLFTDYAKLYHARQVLAPEFNKEFEDHGFKLLGWGDAGMLRIYSDARPIAQPSDLKQVRPWAWTDDILFQTVLKTVGANGVRLGVPEVYPALQTGMIDTLPSSAIAAVSLQWYTHLKYVTKLDMSILIGATILKKDKYDALPADLRAALDQTSEKAHKALRMIIRRDDDKSYKNMLSHGMQEVPVGSHEKEWRDLGKKVRNELVGRLYPASLLKKVEALAGQ